MDEAETGSIITALEGDGSVSNLDIIRISIPTITFTLRGKEITMTDSPFHRADPTTALIIALLSLEDSRIDTILEAFNIRIEINGEVIFPEEDLNE